MKYLNVKQVAEQLGVAATTVYSLCIQKKLAHLRIGTGGRGTIRIAEESLAAFISGATVQPNMPAEPPPPRSKLKHLKV